MFITPEYIQDRYSTGDWSPDKELLGKYYEIAVEDLEPQIRWCDPNDGDFSKLLLGLSNPNLTSVDKTKIIAEGCKSSAAKVALDYKGGGKTDWFLPSTPILSHYVYSGLAKSIKVERKWWTNSLEGSRNPVASGIIYQPNLGGEGHYQVLSLFESKMLVRPVRVITASELSLKLEELKLQAELKAKQEAELKAKQEADAKAAADKIIADANREVARILAAAKAKAVAAKVAAKKKTTITCVKGKLTKKVTAVKPECPIGYKLKK